MPLTISTPGILANDTDPDGNSLTAALVSTAAHGSLSLNPNGSFTYTPDPNYNGRDSFTYAAHDGVVTGNVATVTINVTPVNDVPVAVNDTYTTPEDVPLIIPAPGILANDLDVDGDALTALLMSNVSKGSLSLNPNGSFTYTPNTNYNGSDSFTYRAHDGLTTGNVATVTINITPVNDPPIAVNDSASVREDENVNVRVLDNDSDPEGAPLTVTGTSTTNGTAVISGNGTRVIFTPSTNFNGIVVFSYTVSDGTNSATASVIVTVIPVNDAPVANHDAYTTLEDAPLSIPTPGILANDTDVDGDTLMAVLVSDVSHGTLALNADGSFAYTPVADYNGPDSFTYRAADSSATGNVAIVTINVTPVSDPLKFTSQQMTANGFELQVAGDASAYVISASSNLQDWTPIFTNAAPTGPIVYTDTAAYNYPSRFYRMDAR